ncbi:MAG TPA: signal peptidase II [Planctomycetota bacterium]|nr:signal peptidase II [Planctomycetota bacterium]
MKRHAAVFGALALALAGLDLLTKTLALARVPHHGEHKVIPGWFSIGHEYNPGVIWSFMQNAPWLWLVVSILAIPLIAVIFVRSRKTWATTICLGMIESGTIGNCWDRIFHPGVRDFIKFYYVQANGHEKVWPLFNLADSCIVVGVILLSVEMFFFEEKKAANTPKSQLPNPNEPPNPNPQQSGGGPLGE